MPTKLYMDRVGDMRHIKYVSQFILSQLKCMCYFVFFVQLFICVICYRCLKEMPRKSSGETYIWTSAKEKKFLEYMDEYLATTGKQPNAAILDMWAAQFNAEFGGVPVFGSTLSQKKERMKKIYRGWKVLQSRIGLGYDPATNRVICSDDAWHSFIQVM